MFRLLWDRITLSRLTASFFLFSLVHCVVLIALQTRAFINNSNAASLLQGIVTKGGVSGPGFSVFQQNELRFCSKVPYVLSTASCQVVWNGQVGKDNVLQSNAERSASSNRPTFTTSNIVTSRLGSRSVFANVALPQTPVPKLASATPTVRLVTASTSSLPTRVARPTNLENDIDQDKQSGTDTTASTPVTKSIAPSISLVDESEPDTTTVWAPVMTGVIPSTSLEDQLGQDRQNETDVVTLTNLGPSNLTAQLEKQCIHVLRYPHERLRNTMREDVSFISFHIWVLGMSTVAILNESIPHIFASLLTHVLATTWAAGHIISSNRFQRQFQDITVLGACAPLSLLPAYWIARHKLALSVLVFNIVSLATSMFFTWRLVKSFGWQTYKRMGASLTIRRIYRNVLIFSITIQLSVFFIGLAATLWVDQTWNGFIAPLADFRTVCKVSGIITIILLWPWLTMGWFAVRREYKIPMLIFLATGLFYVLGWFLLLLSAAFRWTYAQWFFFATITTMSILLMTVSLVLGIVCRLDFGKGLPNYLLSQELLDDDDGNNDVKKFDYLPQEQLATAAELELSSKIGYYHPVMQPPVAHIVQQTEGSGLSRQGSSGSERSLQSSNTISGSMSRSKRLTIE